MRDEAAMRSRRRGARRPWVAAAIGVLLGGMFADGTSSAGDAIDGANVRVEHSPEKPTKKPNLEFLKTNRDFFRGQLDALRQIAGKGVDGGARLIDPRTLRYQEMLDEIARERAAVSGTTDRFLRAELLAAIEELAMLDAEVAGIESTLTRAEDRLAEVARDVESDQRAEILIVLSCEEGAEPPVELELREDGELRARIVFVEVEREALRRGGIAEIHRHLAEPRPHAVDARCVGAAPAETSACAITVTPERDQLTIVEMTLARAAEPSASPRLEARAWAR
ncbi:MAG: hypothetical protein ACKVU1_06080 [bacterium]